MKETLRYLGLTFKRADKTLLSRLERVGKAVQVASRPASCWRLEKVDLCTDGVCRIGDLKFTSDSLARTLDGCSYAFLFAATLGTGVDTLLRRYGQTAPADLVIAQATATALIEKYCDECEKKMRMEVPGAVLRARFSPGYGDLPLACQTDLLAHLDATRRLGIALTDALLMVPSKSVSAIIGVKVPSSQLY